MVFRAAQHIMGYSVQKGTAPNHLARSDHRCYFRISQVGFHNLNDLDCHEHHFHERSGLLLFLLRSMIKEYSLLLRVGTNTLFLFR